MLSEHEGRVVLRGAFQERGYAIREDVPFLVGDATISLDGYDAAAAVGYEYISSEDGRSELTDEVIERLDHMMERGQHFIFLVDEHQVDDPDHLRVAALRFLDELSKRR